MIAEGVTWTTGRTYYRDTELFSVTFPGSAHPPPWINISQTSVERYLLARVAEQPQIELRPGCRVAGLASGPDWIDATTAAGVRFRGSYLIGADGPHSAVRKVLGIDFPGRSFDDQFLICDIRADLPFPSERRFYFDPEWNPDRQVLVHQCPDRVWRIDYVGDKAVLKDQPQGLMPGDQILGSISFEQARAIVGLIHEISQTLARYTGELFLQDVTALETALAPARGR